MPCSVIRVLSSLFLLVLCLCYAVAEVRLPVLFSDHMVLQQGRPVPVWGWANAGEAITVSFGKQRQRATADADGHWRVTLKPMATDAAPRALTVSGENTIVLNNVLVGEVWVCSGQSNMAFQLPTARDAQAEIAAADYPQIRMFTVTPRVAATPQADAQGNWLVCSPQNAPSFSALGYFFARHLALARKTPVGIIQCAWSGLNIVGFIPRAAFAADPNIAYCISDVDERFEREPGNPFIPTGVFNGMIAPLAPYAVAGFAWYQGETNAMGNQGLRYRQFLPALIHGWRQAWGQRDIPFLYVQLPNYGPPAVTPGDSPYAEVREAQLLTRRIQNTGMVVTIDIGDPANIHPANKQEFGRRLGLAAQAVAYKDKKVHYLGPLYRGMRVQGNVIQLRFSFADGGLHLPVGEELSGFSICGEDGIFVDADASIKGTRVLVSSPDVPNPVAVRYGWADSPRCNLFNGIGLPASPFRSDVPEDLPPLSQPWR